MSSYLKGEVDFPVNAKYSKKLPTQDERNVEIVSKTASRLVHQSELGVPVAKIPNLRLSPIETVVTLAKVALPVLPLAVNDAKDCKDQDANLATQVDSMACGVLWCVRRYISPLILLAYGLVWISLR
jgi:hypothetical protein